MKTRMIYEIRSNNFSKFISLLLIISMVFQTNSCYYYKAVIPSQTPPEVLSQDLYSKYVMMHNGEEVKRLDNIVVFEDRLTATMDEVVGHDYYINAETGMPRRYKMQKNNNESEVLNEIHLHVSGYNVIDGNEIEIPNNKMVKIQTFNPASGLTGLTWGVGSAAALIGGFTLLLILTSCPFVYTMDGDQYTFSGEIYSGAIKPGLERDDFMKLEDLNAIDNSYKFKLSNEIQEVQYTNLFELLYADHPASMEIMVDKYGDFHTIDEPFSPVSAVNFRGSDLRSELSEKDNNHYYGPELQKDPDLLDGVILEFQVPPNTTEVKLMIRAKNSFWLDYVITKFHDLLGRKYEKFSEGKKNLTREELVSDKLEQHLPVSVYIEENGEWVFSDYFNIAGPVTMKDDILSLKIKSADQPLKIKLEYGTYFWEIDYVGIDVSDDRQIEFTAIKASSALDENGVDVAPMLALDDDNYYVQPDPGNVASVEFIAPEMSDDARTIFLHSKGHYNLVRDLNGKPDKDKLRSLKEGDGLTRLSKELINEQVSRVE